MSSSGPEGFAKGCRWNVFEPSSAVGEPSCEDHKLLDLSSNKYAQANGITSVYQQGHQNKLCKKI